LLKGIKGGGKGEFSREEVYVLRLGDLGRALSRRGRGSLDRVRRHLSLTRMRRLLDGVFLGKPWFKQKRKAEVFCGPPGRGANWDDPPPLSDRFDVHETPSGPPSATDETSML